MTFEAGAPVQKARDELVAGVQGMFGGDAKVVGELPATGAIVAGTLARLRQASPDLVPAATLPADGYWLKTSMVNGARFVVVAGESDRGVLYGAFALLRKVALGRAAHGDRRDDAPYAPIRWVNQWNNLDGSIERGYGGRSIFWDEGHVREDLTRVNDYGRMLASLGINGISINNVNANPRVLAPDFMPQIARIADVAAAVGRARGAGDRFRQPADARQASTRSIRSTRRSSRGGRRRADELYRAVPDFGGFVLKADSEGRVGPSAYGRTHADAANVVARALAPHGGVIFYRGFVYDHHMDWHNPKNDRARAAVRQLPCRSTASSTTTSIVQIKNGPIDFQVREPASPLFGALEHTNQAIELQITQEYMGQARHTVFLVPMWKETLDFDMQRCERPGTGQALVSGKTFHRPVGGFVGVSNVGLDANWFGNHLSQANLYGFGRLAWNPDLTSRADRRRVDAADVRQTIRKSCETISAHSAQLVAHLRELHRTAGPADADRHRRQPLRRGRRSVRAQRLGAMAPRRRQGRRHGSDGRDRHGIHRPIRSRCGAALRIARRLSGRSAALHASRAVHAPSALREDGHSVHLRLPLRRRRRRSSGFFTTGKA